LRSSSRNWRWPPGCITGAEVLRWVAQYGEIMPATCRLAGETGLIEGVGGPGLLEQAYCWRAGCSNGRRWFSGQPSAHAVPSAAA
jgi:hypothetical protein